MPRLPKAIPILIAVIALDFAMVFGFEALRIFTSPIYGLDRPAFASLIYGIGGLADVKAEGLFKLAAFFAAIYLTTSIVFVLHIASRIAALRGGRVSHDLLDAGLILVVISTMVAAMPAILAGATDILVQDRLPLWLVGLAATLSMIERLPDMSPDTRPGLIERIWARFAARRNDSMIVTPEVRCDGTAIRWDDLRTAGGMAIEPVPITRPLGQISLRSH